MGNIKEVYDKLKNGEDVTCTDCNKGIMKAIGNPENTHCFQCTECGNRWWFDSKNKRG